MFARALATSMVAARIRAPIRTLTTSATCSSLPVTSPSSSIFAAPERLVDIPPAEDPLLRFFASALLRHGHRARANQRVSRLLLHLHAFTRAPPLPILREAVSRAAPAVRCLMHRAGAKTVANPVPLGEKERVRWAVKWILERSKERAGWDVEERVAREVILVLEGKSKVLEDKNTVHKFAMLNRGNVKMNR